MTRKGEDQSVLEMSCTSEQKLPIHLPEQFPNLQVPLAELLGKLYSSSMDVHLPYLVRGLVSSLPPGGRS